MSDCGFISLYCLLEGYSAHSDGIAFDAPRLGDFVELGEQPSMFLLLSCMIFLSPLYFSAFFGLNSQHPHWDSIEDTILLFEL